jgi:hypothetical protein
MPAHSLYAQMRGDPEPEPWPIPAPPTPEEEAEYEAILAEMRADYLATHYRTAEDARNGIAGRLIDLTYKLAWESHRKCRAIDAEDLAGEMLLALSVWLLDNISDENCFWWDRPLGGLSIKQHGGTMLRLAFDVMRKARVNYFKTLPERDDPRAYRILRWEVKTSAVRRKWRRRTWCRVRQTLAAIDPFDRQLLEMLRDGLTERGIAEKIKKPKSSVHRRLQQAKDSFRDFFVKKWGKTGKGGS